jgi:Outer membrane protein beta-barrel domain
MIMTRIIFSAFLVLFFQAQLLHAQIKILVGGGANFSNISISKVDFVKPNTATNYFLSARPELGLTENLNIGLDIQFSRKGYNFDIQDSQDIAGYRFQYLDLIPQAQYKIIKELAFYGGLGLAIGLSEKYKINDVWKESVYKINNSSDFTYILGVRVFPIEKLSAHLQFASSLTSISDIEITDNQGQTIDIAKTFLKNFQLGIAYQIF